MRYRPLGEGGPEVSVVGLGCNQFGGRVDEAGTRACVEAALDVGITLLDTADVYGQRGDSETFIGRALEGRRDRVVLATKFGNQMPDLPQLPTGSREYIRLAVEASLRRLQTDWIDLYQYHHHDGVTPLEETLGALNELVEEGKARTGKYRHGEGLPSRPRLVGPPQPLRNDAWDEIEALESYAEDRGRTLLEVTIGGLAAQPAIGSVIAGATKPEQVRANAAAGAWEPTPEDLAALRGR